MALIAATGRAVLFGICAALFLFTVASASSQPLAAGASMEPPYQSRLEALLARMTLEEKIGQLNQYSGFWDFTGPRPTGGKARLRIRHLEQGQVGAMLNVVGADKVRAIQQIAVEKTRLGIPLLFAFDVVHGHSTIFPIPLAEASSWDLEAIERSARIAATEAAAQGVNWTFAPMVDISRDPRWGRVMEGAGEDPMLGAAIATARVRGFQGTNLAAINTIAACAKHFAGYGFAEAGKDYNAAEIGTSTLFNVILPPFRAAVRDANVKTVMNAFNTINGVPATGDPFLQREILKTRWGLTGFVVSDWGSGREMIDHGFAHDGRHAAALAMMAGSDMDMESRIYVNHLADLVRDGTVDEARINDAVRRILTIKFELGLFDDPYRYADSARERETLDRDSHRTATLEMAKKSIVLLKNDGDLLPLGPGKRIAVIGALAADKDSPLGNWRGRGKAHSAVSLVEGLTAKNVDFTYAKGAEVEIETAHAASEVIINETDHSGFEEAVAVARGSDVVIMVLGEDGLQSGEGRSRADLGFPGVQQKLLEAVYAVNRKIILVVMSGRPLILTWADEHLPAIVQAWHLGSQSGHALASVLTGETNPSGKLPMTFPRSMGQVPIYYNHLPTGRPHPRDDVFWSHYNDESNAPLYPFGHGLSYTTFLYSDLVLSKDVEGIAASVTVTNTGDRQGQEVVQLYIRDRVARISRPVKELKAFKKIALAPNESQSVTFRLTAKDLGYYTATGEFVTDPGDFDLFVGGSSDAPLTTEFTW